MTYYKIRIGFDINKDDSGVVEECVGASNRQKAREYAPKIANASKITQTYDVDIQERYIGEAIELETNKLYYNICKICERYNMYKDWKFEKILRERKANEILVF